METLNICGSSQTHRRWRICALLLCLILIGPLLSACGQAQSQRPPLKVVATIPPLADWARQVGGDLVQVTQIVPAGVDAATYAPSPGDQAAIASADVLLFNGFGIEPWLNDAMQATGDAPLVTLDLSQYLGIRTGGTHTIVRTPLEAEERGQNNDKTEFERVFIPPSIVSPYLWLNPGPTMAQQAVWLIADTFTRVDVDNLLVYRRNADRYVGELENLDNWIRRQIRSWPHVRVGSRDLLAIQSADRSWHYFAQHYTINLRTVTTINTFEPRIPASTPLFVNRYLDEAERLRIIGLREPDGLLDPFADNSYIALMKYNVDVMTKGIQQAARNQPQQFKPSMTGS